ncbi:putative phosphohydrolase [Prosthecobacter fusiformis]|uniref:Putative phosphohydrolase n=1 Tax=Prosthecobacter fusiformis TaxID=48464 RepID=A0A4R7S621_9BACT|nr:metallophosphoesterase [Prosthecobacter fusiformis]TDU72855.1 putative phosphohydrolase [Prosthecobacter fusiformis]
MRLRILSDLHREFGPTSIPAMDADVVILAGDIGTKQNALPWIHEVTGNTPTVYVCGNHEFYGDKLPRVTERLKEQTAGSHIHVLENEAFEVDGWHIYGCTLWTDLALHGEWSEGANEAGDRMNDYKRIRTSSQGYRKLLPRDTRAIHLESVQRLSEFLSTHDPQRTIIVTHHAPSARSLPESRRAELISSAYASHLDGFIENHQPYLWIHGHIHHSQDYCIGTTRVIANPQGYPNYPNIDFLPRLVVEI